MPRFAAVHSKLLHHPYLQWTSNFIAFQQRIDSSKRSTFRFLSLLTHWVRWRRFAFYMPTFGNPLPSFFTRMFMLKHSICCCCYFHRYQIVCFCFSFYCAPNAKQLQYTRTTTCYPKTQSSTISATLKSIRKIQACFVRGEHFWAFQHFSAIKWRHTFAICLSVRAW